MMISIGEAAEIIGVSISTLRRWEKEEQFLPSIRTLGGYRRYSLIDIQKKIFAEKESLDTRKTVCYARVSSYDQKNDLKRQIKKLEKYCNKNNFEYTVIKDLGSGMNYKKRGLSKLIEMICKKRVKKLILTNKDRLLRFGSELLFSLCRLFNVEVVILNEVKNKTFEEELVGDVIEIMTVFTSKIYGKRSHLNKKVV